MKMKYTVLTYLIGFFLVPTFGPARAFSQVALTDTASQVQPNALAIPVVPIADEPKSIDPAELLDKRLSARVPR